mgnify:CR=1 FL=1
MQGIDHGHLVQGMPATLINDGTGRFRPQRLVLDGRSVDDTAVTALLGPRGFGYMPRYGRFTSGSRGRVAPDLLLYRTESFTRSPFEMETSVSMTVMTAR